MNAVCPETWNAERTVLAVEALRCSGFLRLQLRGVSMLPSLWPGDEVEIASCLPTDIRRGDVVLAFRNRRFILHRVSGFSEAGDVITRGDAMPRPDPPVPADEIVGKVTQVTRGCRTFSASQRCAPFPRAFGILVCYSGLARRIALRLHNWRVTTTRLADGEYKTSDSSRFYLCSLTSDLFNPGS